VEDLRLLIGEKTALVASLHEGSGSPLPHLLRKALLGRPWVRTDCALRPLVSGYVYYRGCEGEYVDVAELEGESGVVDLVFGDGRGETEAVPLLRFEVITSEGSLFDPPFSLPIGR
jgi:hypothetical protein